MSLELNQPRAEIDRIDREIVSLLARRLDVVREVSDRKGASTALPLRDDAREQEVIASWSAAAAEHGLSAYHMGRVLREVLSYSRRVQEHRLASNGLSDALVVLRVGFQGVRGSYSDLAIGKVFALRTQATVERVGFRTFDEVVDALEEGELEYALLPIENTIAGSLNDVYQLLAQRNVTIVDEEVWQVEHCLVGLPGSTLDDIKTIRSHPMALQQCQKFLTGLIGCVSESDFDTAGSAEAVAVGNDPQVAAICSREGAERLGLHVIHDDISDHPDNFTRFVLLSMTPERIDARQRGKVSLLFTVNHRRGALADCLQIFARENINLTKIESRPKAESPWEYLFYVDIEGHADQPVVQQALDAVRALTNHFKILGSYPNRTHELGDGAAIHSSPTAVDESSETLASAAGEKAARRVAIAEDSIQRTASPPEPSVVHIGDVGIGGKRFVLMLGPCAVESREQIMSAAGMVKDAGAAVLRGGAFKPRTSPSSFQGLGFPGLRMLADAGRAYELPIVTEVLQAEDVERIAESADALQVGARNMQNFALLKKLGVINKPILLKRGMSATINELLHAAEYIIAGGNQRIILCERGIRTFETATRNTLDLSAIPVLKARTNLPVVVDPSHAAGDRTLVVPLALAAAAAGADGLLIEAHPDPESALCDGPQALRLPDLARLVQQLGPILQMQGRTL